MDHQDHTKPHTPGQDGHGVHVCHKCGWPFPKLHPSAKQRRAHKRICGTIEGYKLVDSEGNPHLNGSDDEQLSDEDHKPPGPKILEKIVSNRSEDEVFTDAVAEFSESGTNLGIEEALKDAQEPATNVEKVVKDDPKMSKSFKDGDIADIIQPPSISSDSSQTGNPEVPEFVINRLRTAPEFVDNVSTLTISSKSSSISDCITEESVVPSDSNTIKPETLIDAPHESEETNPGKDLMEHSFASIVQEADAKGTEETNLDRNLMDSLVSPIRFAGKSIELVSKLEETVGKTSDPVPADSVVQPGEDHDDGSSSKMSQNDLTPEVDSAVHDNASIDTSQVKVDAAQVVKDHASSSDTIESGNKKEGSYNLHVLPVSDDSSDHVNASIDDSDPVPADSVVQSGEDHDDGSSSKMSQNDLTPEVDSAVHGNASIDTSQVKVDAAQVVKDHASSSDTIESGYKKEEGSYNLHVLPVSDDSSDHVNASIDDSDPVPADSVVQSGEDHDDGSSSKMSQNDLTPEVDSAVHDNASIDTSQVKVDAAQVVKDHASSSNTIESGYKKEEGSYNLHVLPVSDDSSDHVNASIDDSDPLPADSVVQSGEDHDDGSSSKMSQNDLTPEVDSAVHNNASIDTSQIKVGAAQVVKDHVSSGDIIESGNKKEEGSYSLHVLPVPDDFLDHVNASVDASQFKMNAAEGIHCANSGNMNKSCIGKEERNENEYVLSVQDDTSILDPPAIVVEDFKDNKGVKLHEYASLGTCSPIMDKEDGANGSSSEEQYSSFQPRRLNEGAELPSSDIHVLEDSGEQEGSSKTVVNEVLVEEEADVSQIKIKINEIGAPAEVVTPDMDENHTVRSHEEQETHDIHDDALQVSFLENATKFSSDVGINQGTNLVGVDDADNCEKSMTERLDGIGDNNGKAVTEETYTKISRTNSESIGNLSESPVYPTINIPEGDDEAGDHEKSKIEECDVDGIESKDGSKEDDLSMKTKLTSESASSSHESQTVADNIMDGSVMKLPEHGCREFGNNSVSDTGINEDEINGNDEVKVESIGGSTANESNHGGHVKSLQETSGNHMTKESHLSPLDTESSFQSSAAVEENHAREFGGDASGITSKGLQGDNDSVKQQVAASAIDVSVDSFSQTDSLEGNWGSVSVLSTQSDAAAVIDAEALPSSDKNHLEKSKGAPERQHSEKSDTFEAPSFMTLVEPRDGVDQKAANASEIQTGQNLQQQSASLQAGWFPSLTHVVNESQGRKKNEEIIAKVTNWSTGKQHTPLKTLLGEASLETKQKSPRPKENPAPAIKKDETVPKDNGAIATTVNNLLGPESPTNDAAKTQAKKEWNSPARYHSEIKREKRKVKGRPYWVQFVCCSSMN